MSRSASAGSPSWNPARTNNYNALGNLQTKNEASTVSLTYADPNHAHAPSSVNGVSYVYDPAGNLIQRGTTTYSYDWQNHLVTVNQNGQVTSFGYDADGNLAKRTDPDGTVTDYFGDLYEKNKSTGVETKRYAFGGSLVATLVGGVRTYLYPAALNSVAGSSDGASTVYTSYGLVRQSSGTLPTDHQFQGQQNQASIGLYHMGARWYDSTIGVWTQPDSVVPNPLDPLTLNRYAFVNGNPLRYADPTGHSAASACQDPNGCPNGNPPPNPGASSSESQLPEDGQNPCLLFVCVPVGNYAVRVYACDASGCSVWTIPIPGAIPPPDSASDASKFSDDDEFAKLLKDYLPTDEILGNKGDPLPKRFGTLLEKAGIRISSHLLLRLGERSKESGISEEMIVDAYKNGEMFYDPEYGTRIHYNPKDGIAVAELRDGEVNSVWDADHPSPHWEPWTGWPDE